MAEVADTNKQQDVESKQIKELTGTVNALQKALAETRARLQETEEKMSKMQDAQTALDEELEEEIDENEKTIKTNKRKIGANLRAISSLKQYQTKTALSSKIDKAKKQYVTTKPRDFLGDTLTIRAPYRTTEPVIEKALKQFEKTYENTREPLAEFIVEKGIASEIRAVTQYISQRKTSSLRKKIWAVAYDKTLFDILERHSKRGNTRELETVVDDTEGLAQKIISKLEEPEGPVSDFATVIYQLTVKRNDLQPDKEADEQVPTLIKEQLF